MSLNSPLCPEAKFFCDLANCYERSQEMNYQQAQLETLPKFICATLNVKFELMSDIPIPDILYPITFKNEIVQTFFFPSTNHDIYQHLTKEQFSIFGNMLGGVVYNLHVITANYQLHFQIFLSNERLGAVSFVFNVCIMFNTCIIRIFQVAGNNMKWISQIGKHQRY